MFQTCSTMIRGKKKKEGRNWCPFLESAPTNQKWLWIFASLLVRGRKGEERRKEREKRAVIYSNDSLSSLSLAGLFRKKEGRKKLHRWLVVGTKEQIGSQERVCSSGSPPGETRRGKETSIKFFFCLQRLKPTDLENRTFASSAGRKIAKMTVESNVHPTNHQLWTMLHKRQRLSWVVDGPL